MKIISGVSGIALGVSLTSCTMLPVHQEDPPDFAAPRLEAVETSESIQNWPAPPVELPTLIHQRRHSAVEINEVGAGTTGARKVTLKFPDRGIELDFKWKPMVPPRWVDALPFAPGMLDGVNNSPRKEIAAWVIQELILDEADYVVPPSVAFCVPIEQASKTIPDSEPTLEGTRCVLGVLSLWLQNVTVPDVLLDPKRFQRDPVYAYYLANLNLLTYLVKHHDGREGNFMVSTDDERRRVFAIDNGVSFGGPWYNWFVANWNDIRVPALRRESVERLRDVTQDDLTNLLGILTELQLDEGGVLDAVEPGPNLDPDRGVRYQDGRLQFGLTRDEIEDVWERIEDLLEDVDEGEIAVF